MKIWRPLFLIFTLVTLFFWGFREVQSRIFESEDEPILNQFHVFRTGNLEDVVTPTSPLVCLAGGGDDDSWADGWKELLLSAHGGDVVILRVDRRRGGYEPWLFEDPDDHEFPKINSVTSIVLTSTQDANRPEVIDLVEKAELIFIAGGDQFKFISYIKGTLLHETLLNALNNKKIPFGGTSSGTALMGDISFTGEFDFDDQEFALATSEKILSNPTGQLVSLERGFLKSPFLDRVVTDSHLTQRNRRGRLLGFMAKAATYQRYRDINAYTVKGLGIDEEAALCINEQGKAKVYGSYSAHFLQGNAGIERVKPKASLHWFGNKKAVKVYSIRGHQTDSAEFDLKTWSGNGGESHYWYVDGSNPPYSSFHEFPPNKAQLFIDQLILNTVHLSDER